MFILHIYNSGMNYFIRSSLYRNITHTYITWKYYRNNKTFIFHPEWQDSQHITRLSFHKKSSAPFFLRSHDILIWTDLDVVQLLFSTRKVIKFYSFSQHWIISPQLQPYKISCARTFMIDLIGAIDKILRMVQDRRGGDAKYLKLSLYYMIPFRIDINILKYFHVTVLACAQQH